MLVWVVYTVLIVYLGMNDSSFLRSPSFVVATALAGLLILLAGLRQMVVGSQALSGSDHLAQGPVCSFGDIAKQNQEIYFISCGGIY